MIPAPGYAPGPMPPQLPADVRRYLGAVVVRLHETLGDDLVGVYLVGSGARGGWVRGSSDIDLAVVVERPLPVVRRRDVVERLRHAALPCPAPRLELVVYRRDVVAAPGEPPPFELNLNTGPAIADHVTFDVADEPGHWFVLDLAMAHDVAVAIAGPPPATVIGAVDAGAVRRALRASLAWHADHDTVAPNRVLNACRAWLWTAEGRWASKDEAAAWAASVSDAADAALVRRALALRATSAEAPLPPEAVHRFASRVLALVASS